LTAVDQIWERVVLITKDGYRSQGKAQQGTIAPSNGAEDH